MPGGSPRAAAACRCCSDGHRFSRRAAGRRPTIPVRTRAGGHDARHPDRRPARPAVGRTVRPGRRRPPAPPVRERPRRAGVRRTRPPPRADGPGRLPPRPRPPRRRRRCVPGHLAGAGPEGPRHHTSDPAGRLAAHDRRPHRPGDPPDARPPPRPGAARRRGQPRPADPPDAALAAVLDAELARLPEHYRVAVILCELEGRSRKDVAARLGIPAGTLSSRLAKARKLLAARLSARGVTASAAAVTAALAGDATARVPASVVAGVARAVGGGRTMSAVA